jgi:hypothetical protein
MRKIIQADVDESLNNAEANEYPQRGLSTEAIAVDMGTYDWKFEGLYDELFPFIENWKKRHPNS